jgi:uncharacterized repeat protein (TIGR04138 family)
MKTPIADRRSQPRLLFHPHAYVFVSEALKTAQELVGRQMVEDRLDETHHISGPELLEGVRVLGLRLYGMMATAVFHHWGVFTTHDFGRIVFEMIDRGDMRKSDSDQLSDFHGVYPIDATFADSYQIDVTKAFRTL